MRKYTIFLPLLLLTSAGLSQRAGTDANIIGHVVAEGEHIPFASVFIKGTTVGTTTDESGHYKLLNLPEGSYTLRAQVLGFEPAEQRIKITPGQTIEVNFELETDFLGLEEVVVTGDRNQKNRRESSVIINTVTARQFTRTQSVTLSESLNFSPGLRMENNCQNCGFSQVRMNGMEGPYSQILINGRPIFSGLAGLYGLELIPTNMIERVEIMRGGGSALYGGNAIAGTINLILKDPINNSYEFGVNSGLTGVGIEGSGKPAGDQSILFNSSVTSADNKTGMSLYGFYRNRQPFDANNDSFSELSSTRNITAGSRIYHRFGYRNKLSADFFTINEDRRGGDRHDHPLHESNIAEALTHNIVSGAITYTQFFRENDILSVFASGQLIKRNSYFGANQSLSDYGLTRDLTFHAGAQYNYRINGSKIVFGLDNRTERLNDRKLGYPDTDNAYLDADSNLVIPHSGNTTVVNQVLNTSGLFTQVEYTLEQFKLFIGARFDRYLITDFDQQDILTGNVLIPRINLLYTLSDHLQARISYSLGYRAPQVFDEDLHIETSGSRKVIHRNDPELKQENSNSYMLSLDYNNTVGNSRLGLLAEGFYTHLNNPFVNEIGQPDAEGLVVYTRINAPTGATVRGINFELNFVPGSKYALNSGFTIQRSSYADPQDFDETRFFRTPDSYGFVSFNWQHTRKFASSITGNYTGEMLVPYFGNQIPDPESGELRMSDRFFELGIKSRYNISINGATLQVFAGIKNIFNAYQDDFDRGIDRDPGYVYGPMTPRTVYAGLKIGNLVK